jgi:hypothetical protein
MIRDILNYNKKVRKLKKRKKFERIDVGGLTFNDYNDMPAM